MEWLGSLLRFKTFPVVSQLSNGDDRSKQRNGRPKGKHVWKYA